MIRDDRGGIITRLDESPTERETPAAEVLIVYGVRLPDGRTREFRNREGAVEHIAYLWKTKRPAVLVARTVRYGEWEVVPDDRA